MRSATPRRASSRVKNWSRPNQTAVFEMPTVALTLEDFVFAHDTAAFAIENSPYVVRQPAGAERTVNIEAEVSAWARTCPVPLRCSHRSFPATEYELRM